MKKTYNWTTPRGAKIEMDITTEHITSRKSSFDGWETEVSCNDWMYTIDRMLCNGTKPDMTDLVRGYFVDGGYHDCVQIGVVGKNKLYVMIPDDIAQEIFGEEIAEEKRHKALVNAAAKKYEDDYNKVIRMMER